MRLFVTVGNATKTFDRLLRIVDEALQNTTTPIQGVCQYGVSSSRPRGLIAHAYLSRREFDEEMMGADVVISHAGVGSLWSAIHVGHCPLVIPRRASIDEIVNDHQTEVVRVLTEAKKIVPIETVADLRVQLDHRTRGGAPRLPNLPPKARRDPILEKLLQPSHRSTPSVLRNFLARFEQLVSLWIIYACRGPTKHPTNMKEMSMAADERRIDIEKCPLCSGRESTRWLDALGFKLVRCKTCGFRYSSQIFSPEYLANAYYDEPTPDIQARSNSAKRSRFVEYETMLATLFSEPGQVLDVGCNAGELLGLFHAAGWSVAGIETSPGPARQAKAKFGDDIWQGRVEDILPKDRRFDLITLSHVLEHVQDPTGLAHRLKNALRPKGAILVEVPNADDFLLRVWKGTYRPLCPGDHVSFFDTNSLQRVFESAGFEVVTISSPVHARDLVYASLLSGIDAARSTLKSRGPTTTRGIQDQTRYRGRLRRPLRAALDSVVALLDPLVIAGTSRIQERLKGTALILLARAK